MLQQVWEQKEQKKKRMIVNENKGNNSHELTKSDTVKEKKS